MTRYTKITIEKDEKRVYNKHKLCRKFVIFTKADESRFI
jgi:hypothetical protein